MADMRISELTTAAGLHDGDLFETSQTDSISSSGYASYKTSLSAIAAFIAKQVQYSGDLQTTSKTLIGAINEVFNAGTSVTVTNVLPATETTKRVATITVDGVAKDINADDTVKVITDLKTPKNATITNGIAQFECIEENLVKGLKVTMNPIQDLHGYSNPWVGGAGKNKCPINTASLVRGASESVVVDFDNPLPIGSYILSYTYSGTSTVTRFVLLDESGNTILDPNIASAGSSPQTINVTSPAYKVRIYIGSSQASGATANITDLMVRLSTVTDATFAPYSNICPISGRTEASVTRTGKNKAPINDFTITRGTVETFSPNLPSGTYSISFNATRTGSDSRASSCRLIYDDDTNYEFSFSPSGAVKKENITATKPIKSLYMYSIGGSYSDSGNFTLTISNFQIEEGSTATEYEPYQTPETKTRQYSETIYGGVDDFVNGGASSDMALVDLGNLTWTYNNGVFRSNNISGIPTLAYDSDLSKFACSCYKAKERTAGWANLQNGEYGFVSKQMLIKDDAYTDATTFKSAVTGQTLCYELATPTTISTSAEEITTVSGTNIISGTEPISECQYTELATVDDLIKIIGGQ